MQKILFLVDSPLQANIRALKTLTTLSKKYSITVLHRDEFPKNSEYSRLTNIKYLTVPRTLNSFFRRTVFLGNDFHQSVVSISEENKLNDFDFIYCVDLWTLLTGVWFKKKLNAKLIYDSYEICVETLSQYYPLKDKNIRSSFFRFWVMFTKKKAFRIEKALFGKVDLFITTSNSYLNYFQKKYQVGNSAIVMNCPNLQENITKCDLHELYDIERSKKIILYIGSFNSGRYLENILASADLLKPDIHLLFLGLGPLKGELKKLSKGKNNITVEGPFEMKDTLSLISGADLGVLLLEPSNISKHLASANKVFDFLMVEKPMLLSNSPENNFVSHKSPLHHVLNEYTPSAIGSKINHLIEENIGDSMSYEQMNEVKRLKAIFNWEFQETLLIEAIEGLEA
jgi:hypothetical protein